MANTITPTHFGRAEAWAKLEKIEQRLVESLRGMSFQGGELAKLSMQYPATARELWAECCAAFESVPVPVDEIVPPVASLIRVIEKSQAAIRAIEKSQAAVRAIQDSMGGTHAFRVGPTADEEITPAAVDAAVQELQVLRDEVAGTLAWLKAGPTPASGRKLRTTEEIRAGMERGEYVSIEDAIAQAGETPAEDR